MRGDRVWEDRALKSNFPGFLREPGEESPGKDGINKMAEQKRGFNEQAAGRDFTLKISDLDFMIFVG